VEEFMNTNIINDTASSIPAPQNPATAPLPEQYHAAVLEALRADSSLSFEIHAEDWKGQPGWFSVDVAISGFTPSISNQVTVDYSEGDPEGWLVSMALDSADTYNRGVSESPEGFRAIAAALTVAADLCDSLNQAVSE
jgi:hypothetical protein